MAGCEYLRRAGKALGVTIVSGLIWTGVAQADQVDFTFTGGEQTFTVPAGITTVQVVAIGAPGGGGANNAKFAGAFGAVAFAEVSVSPGQILYVEVGGPGDNAKVPPGNGGAGGFNGGGSGGSSAIAPLGNGGGAGGGASDVRTVSMTGDTATSLASRLVTAAGGGGSGGGSAGGGAGGGGSTGGNGGPGGGAGGGAPGTGATLTAGGTPGGALGVGGAGQSGTGLTITGGGGGGGGLYGGGGGLAGSGTSSAGGGGGGGSSGFAPSITTFAAGPAQTGFPSVSFIYGATPTPAASSAPTGLRAAALAKCKKKRSKAKRRKCRRRAQQLPL
jgi:hypothetical protein